MAGPNDQDKLSDDWNIEDALADPATGTVAQVDGLEGDPLSDVSIRRHSTSLPRPWL